MAKKKNILLIGDWVLEEHWVTGIHRSPTASRTGQGHYRGLNEPSSSTIAFSAAAQVAAVFSKCNDGNFCNVKGIGFWNKRDTETLIGYFGKDGTAGGTPHWVAADEPQKDSNVTLIDCCKNKKLGTTRAIRIYQQSGSGVQLLRRIDWEMPDITEYKEKDAFLKRLMAHIENEPFDAVVIKDVNKGVVTREIIEELSAHRKLRKVPWFVSSKLYRPNWFKSLREVNLQLLIVPQVAAQTAIRESKWDIHCWITRNGYASREALEQVDEIAEEVRKETGNPAYPLIIVLPQGLSLLTKHCTGAPRDHMGLIQSTTEPHSFSIGVRMASVFFPALVASMLDKKMDISDSNSVKDVIDYVLSFTEAWRSKEALNVQDPSEITDVQMAFYPDAKKGEGKIEEKLEEIGKKRKTVEVRRALEWKAFPWGHAKDEWDDAFSKTRRTLGIVTNSEKKESLQLWRAMIELDGYICSVKKKREKLQTIIEQVNSFKSTKQTISLMLVSPPGSGKTSLVRCLAKTAGLRFLQFNITQMIRKEDIFDCFDTIATTQFQGRGEPVLVFFDEINANLESQYVYDAFLAPIEDNVYVRAGKTFSLDPCVWIFAGTEEPSRVGDKKNRKSMKGSDFESRLTIPPITLSYDARMMKQAKTENVYLGVSLLRTIFPDVNRVSRGVMNVFNILPPEMGVRRMKKFIKAFENIQYGRVEKGNVKQASGKPLEELLNELVKERGGKEKKRKKKESLSKVRKITGWGKKEQEKGERKEGAKEEREKEYIAVES